MKRNLNCLKKMISKLSSDHGRNLSAEERFDLLNEIIFFRNRMEVAPFVNSKTKNVELVKARTVQLRAAKRTYSPGTTFIRARKVDAVLESPTMQDFWEPPCGQARRRRINESGEPALYVTCDTLTAKKEIRLTENDIYNLSFYRTKSHISVTEIGFPQEGKLDAIEKTIEQFLHNLFLREGNSVYEISNFMAKRYFSLSGDGWVYPSVANGFQGENICLNIASKEKLDLIGVFVFCKDSPVASYEFADPGRIRKIDREEAGWLWNDFSSDSAVFGKIRAVNDPTPFQIVRQLPNLDAR